MVASTARILANRKNSLLSTGPRTAEGKEKSRRNGLKHGLTGEGVVIPEADLAAVEVRTTAFQEEMAPKSALGTFLVGQLALLSVRLERGMKQEFAGVAAKVRHAGDDFDEARVEQAEGLWNGIGDNPRANLRKLRKLPEGVELMLEVWHALRADLTLEGKPLWTAAHLVKAASLLGIREEEARGSRMGRLSRAVWGDFEGLADHEGAGLSEEARKAGARTRLVELIDEKVADLAEHYETLDFEMLDQDRDEAGARALFDPSKEACLARRYEAATNRRFFKAYDEFRQAEGEVETVEPAIPAQLVSPSHSLETTSVPLASSCEDPPPDSGRTPEELIPEVYRSLVRDDPDHAAIVRGPDGEPIRARRPIAGPAAVVGVDVGGEEDGGHGGVS